MSDDQKAVTDGQHPYAGMGERTAGGNKKRNIIIGVVIGVVVLVGIILIITLSGSSKPDPHHHPVNPNDP